MMLHSLYVRVFTNRELVRRFGVAQCTMSISQNFKQNASHLHFVLNFVKMLSAERMFGRTKHLCIVSLRISPSIFIKQHRFILT